jgi:hypothetical protein
MDHEAPEWPRSDLGSFEIGAPDPKTPKVRFRFLAFYLPHMEYEESFG